MFDPPAVSSVLYPPAQWTPSIFVEPRGEVTKLSFSPLCACVCACAQGTHLERAVRDPRPCWQCLPQGAGQEQQPSDNGALWLQR